MVAGHALLAAAARVLERAGHCDVSVVLGGPDDWVRSTGRALVVRT